MPNARISILRPTLNCAALGNLSRNSAELISGLMNVVNMPGLDLDSNRKLARPTELCASTCRLLSAGIAMNTVRSGAKAGLS